MTSAQFDQIFILKSLLNKYTNVRNGKLYGCFVDFRKAFDSVWHKGLFYKLISQYNVGGELYGFVKSMYSIWHSPVWSCHVVTKYFNINKGIKQGDTLSPYLFNMYLNDINKIVESDKCVPPSLGNHKISSLLYADDLLIWS